MVKKFEFWWPRLRGAPSLWYPQTLSHFILNLYLSILKISSIQREWLKSLNFDSSVLGRSLYFNTPCFIKNYLLFIIVNHENFMCLTCTVKKFRILASSCEETSHFGTQNLVKFYLSFIFTHLKHFHVSG